MLCCLPRIVEDQAIGESILMGMSVELMMEQLFGILMLIAVGVVTTIAVRAKVSPQPISCDHH